MAKILSRYGNDKQYLSRELISPVTKTIKLGETFKGGATVNISGAAQYLSYASTIMSAGGYTSLTWTTAFRVCKTGNINGGIFGKTQFGSFAGRFATFYDGGNLYTYVHLDTGAKQISLGGILKDGKDHIVTTVWDGSNLYVYVDGVFSSSVAAVGTLPYLNKSIFIGAYGDANVGNGAQTGYYFPGYIYLAEVYDEAKNIAYVKSIAKQFFSQQKKIKPIYYKEKVKPYRNIKRNVITSYNMSKIGTIVPDISQSNKNITAIGAMVNEDGGLRPGAGTSYLRVDSSSGTFNKYPISVEFRMKHSLNSAAYYYVFSNYTSGSGNGFLSYIRNGKVGFYFFANISNYISDGGTDTFSTVSTADGNWHTYTFTIDATGGKIYLDGVLANSLAWTGTPAAPTTTNNMIIFNTYNTGGNPTTLILPATIEDISFYNESLSLNDIKAYQNKRVKTPVIFEDCSNYFEGQTAFPYIYPNGESIAVLIDTVGNKHFPKGKKYLGFSGGGGRPDIPSDIAYGKWVIYHKHNRVTSSPTNYEFISNTRRGTGNTGYFFRFNADNTVTLGRFSGTNTFTNLITSVATFALNNVYKVEITRSIGGVFKLWVDGTYIGTATDNTYTTCKFFGSYVWSTNDGLYQLEIYPGIIEQ